MLTMVWRKPINDKFGGQDQFLDKKYVIFCWELKSGIVKRGNIVQHDIVFPDSVYKLKGIYSPKEPIINNPDDQRPFQGHQLNQSSEPREMYTWPPSTWTTAGQLEHECLSNKRWANEILDSFWEHHWSRHPGNTHS